MAQEHENKHSKASEEAMKDNDRHGAGTSDAIPGADAGGHARSEAAHLHGDKAHTKAAGDQRALVDKEETTRKDGRATESYRNA